LIISGKFKLKNVVSESTSAKIPMCLETLNL
jgi:hypothetical protein